jgi:wobble nucleotide-excising tRNase
MIKEIKEIRSLGIFEDYRSSTKLENFRKFNLFYGWNGSGKTTLSKLFRLLETNEKLVDFPNLEFKVDSDLGIIDQKMVLKYPGIKVFNADFIEENTDFENARTESILYLGKEQVDLKKEIKKLEGDLILLTNSHVKSKEKHDNNLRIEEKFYVDAGSELKEFHAKTIFSRDTYDKRTSKSLWKDIRAGNSLDDFIYSQDEFSNVSSFIERGKEKQKVELIDVKLDQKDLNDLYELYQEIVHRNPVLKSIDRLKKNPELQKWVESGLGLHEKYSSLHCEYCGQDIRGDRTKELEDHFSKEFKKLKQDAKSLLIELERRMSDLPVDETSNIYDKYSKLYSTHFNQLSHQYTIINDGLQNWISTLKSKLINPLNTSIPVTNIVGVEVLKSHCLLVNGIISNHNNDVREYQKESKKNKNKLDLHWVASKAKRESFVKHIQNIDVSADSLKEAKRELDECVKEIENKKSHLSDETIVLSSINKDLHKFLGKNEITLVKSESGGYNLKRQNENAVNLSEGEKTAIALVFFINKLGEKGNDIVNTIVVLDDPISSFDSNHLFNACSYSMNHCKDAKQVFVFTHNFWYFKLVRDWIKRRNKKQSKKREPDIGLFYQIQSGSLLMAEKALVNHHSEYHFVFSSLKSIADNGLVSFENNFMIANMARRLLESFNAFKTPSTEGFGPVLEKAVHLGLDENDKEKIFFFLNKYSHLDRIETLENVVENVAEEGQQISRDVLSIIELVDKDHYNSMCKLCQEA